MTAVMRVLPGEWDGRRLLRFLAGLAMLALAFTAPVPPAASPAPAAAVVAVESRIETQQPESQPAQVELAVPASPIVLPVLVIAATVLVLAGRTPRVRAGRAPPAV